MSGLAPQIEWYIARDGAQHGPISDVEMRKFVELGHLRANDLVWCARFTEWQSAAQAFPEHMKPRPTSPVSPIAPSAPSAPRLAGDSSWPEGARLTRQPDQRTSAPQYYAPLGPTGSPAGGNAPTSSAEFDDFRPEDPVDNEPPARGGRVGRLAAISAALLIVGGLGWIGWQNRTMVSGASAIGGMLVATMSSAPSPEVFRAGPYDAPGETKDLIDVSLQKSAVWRVLKRDFSDWYTERLADVERMRTQRQDEKVVTKFLADVIVTLRRRNGQAALQSSPEHLKQMASAFVTNLKQLASRDGQTCYGLISYGEASPFMLELSRTPAFAETLQKQLVAIFEAITDGRTNRRIHPATRRTDYDFLTKELTARGWTQADLATFSDPQKLSSSPPEKVCALVQEWFLAQVALKDAELQARLLAESLKPLVGG